MFSIAYDVYCQIQDEIERRLNEDLYETETDLFAAMCPACIYRTDNEDELQHSMLAAMDGNESLKRVKRSKLMEDGETRVYIEHEDDRSVHSHIFYRTQ